MESSTCNLLRGGPLGCVAWVFCLVVVSVLVPRSFPLQLLVSSLRRMLSHPSHMPGRRVGECFCHRLVLPMLLATRKGIYLCLIRFFTQARPTCAAFWLCAAPKCPRVCLVWSVVGWFWVCFVFCSVVGVVFVVGLCRFWPFRGFALPALRCALALGVSPMAAHPISSR